MCRGVEAINSTKIRIMQNIHWKNGKDKAIIGQM